MNMQTGPAQFDKMLSLIGKLNYSWTNTESLLIHLIAGLARVDKETALIIFLTLNTTRARVDLVERLAKRETVGDEERTQVLPLTREMLKLAKLRNHYNHSIYAFDADSGTARTILMRIADRKNDIKVGRATDIDEDAITDMDVAIKDLSDLNTAFWRVIKALDYPT